MGRPRLLDLFCGAGGASHGYHPSLFSLLRRLHDEDPPMFWVQVSWKVLLIAGSAVFAYAGSTLHGFGEGYCYLMAAACCAAAVFIVLGDG